MSNRRQLDPGRLCIALTLDASGTVGVWGGTTQRQRRAMRTGRALR